MGFVEESLVPDERVVYRAHVHWSTFALPFFFLVATAVFVVWGLAVDGLRPLIYLGYVFAAVTVIIGVERWIRFASSEFAVTDHRVLIKVGVIRRHSIELLLDKVEGIGVDQTLWGRILGYGTILVTGTGGTRESFHDIAGPMEFRRQVQARVGGAKTE